MTQSFSPSQHPRCRVPKCKRANDKAGYCTTHYTRVRRHGDPLHMGRASSTPGVTQAFKKAWLIEYKLSRGCVDCGYSAHHAALDFDHLPGFEKVRDIKSGNQLGWEALLAEVAKCEVVCANCHRIRTVERCSA